VRRFDLHSLRFGESSEVTRAIPVEIAPFDLGGLEYGVPGGTIEVELVASRVGTRISLKGHAVAHLVGVCQRCLDDADVTVPVDCEEYVKDGFSEGDDGYTRGWVLDLESWLRDGIAGELPAQMLCRDDCRGLCQECGVDLNTVDGDHTHAGA
jgi:uncharacterized protein